MKQALTRQLRKLLPINPGEGAITALMFTYIFGVLFFYYVLDPLRKGLFLQNFSSSLLPYAYFLTALVAGTIATLAFKLSRRWSAITLVTVINALIIGTLFYFRWAMGREFWYLPWIYFCYVKTVSVLSTAQFWLLAGYVYDGRQAKRIYSLLGTGAILGAIAGSFVPGFLSSRLSTESMLALCIAVCALLILLSQIAWRYRRTREEEESQALDEDGRTHYRDLLPTIFGSPHLRTMSALIFLTLIASQIADWQLDDATQRHFSGDQASITRFYGQFSFGTNILAVTAQVLLANFIINRAGVFAAIILLPAGVFLSSGVFMLMPALLTASLVRGSDTVFRYSLNRAGLEMLYLPLTPTLRSRLKLFVDVFIDRIGRAVAGVVILVLVSSYFPFGSRGTAVVTMVLTFLCLVACFRLRGTYLNAFRDHLKRRELELEDVGGFVNDTATVEVLVGSLRDANERQILYSLRLLQSVREVDFSESLYPLLSHPSPYVRAEVVRTLVDIPAQPADKVRSLLEDSSIVVRTAAAGYLGSRHPEGPEAGIRHLLESENSQSRVAAARWLAENRIPSFRLSPKLLDELCEIQGEDAVAARAAAASLAAYLPPGVAGSILGRLIRDIDPGVARAAAVAAGSTGQMKLAFQVANMLGKSRQRAAGRAGLLSYGERVVGTLGDLLRDARIDLNLRREIPWVLGRIPVQKSVDVLGTQLASSDSLIRYRAVKALNRLHETHNELKMPAEDVEAAIQQEVRFYRENRAMRSALGSGLLVLALEERSPRHLETLFRLLGLCYAQKDIHFAYLALKDGHADRRVSAIEFLDNVMSPSLKAEILPLLDEDSLVDSGTRNLRAPAFVSADQVYAQLLTYPDPWLKSCALHEIGDKRLKDLVESLRGSTDDDNPIVRETAAWAIARCS